MTKTSNKYNACTYILDKEKASITCLKCGITSSRPFHYEDHYCPKCGYHNDIESQKIMHDVENL